MKHPLGQSRSSTRFRCGQQVQEDGHSCSSAGFAELICCLCRCEGAKIALFECKSPAELLQSLAAPRALLFASTLQGPAAYLPALNKMPRARYSAQSVGEASPCSLTEAESQMRGINEHRPPVSAFTSARREGSRARGGKAGTVCCFSTSTNEPAAPPMGCRG